MWKDKIKSEKPLDPLLTPQWVMEAFAAGHTEAEILPHLKEWLKNDDGSYPSDASVQMLMDFYRGNYGD